MNGISPAPAMTVMARLSKQPSGVQGIDPDALAKAGEEFESVFLSMMLKTMRSTVSENGMFAGDESDTLGSMFDMFMSQHLATTDSLGMGTMIQRFLDNSSSTPQQ